MIPPQNLDPILPMPLPVIAMAYISRSRSTYHRAITNPGRAWECLTQSALVATALPLGTLPFRGQVVDLGGSRGMAVSGSSQGQISRIQLKLPSQGTVTSADDIQVTIRNPPGPCTHCVLKVAWLERKLLGKSACHPQNPNTSPMYANERILIHTMMKEIMRLAAVGGRIGGDGRLGRPIAYLVGRTYRACVCIGHPCLHAPGVS